MWSIAKISLYNPAALTTEEYSMFQKVPTNRQPLGKTDRKYSCSWSAFPLGPWADKNNCCRVRSFGTVRSTFDQRHSQQTCSFSEHNMHPPNTKARTEHFQVLLGQKNISGNDQD